MTPRKTPANLGLAATRFYRTVTKSYQLRPDEQRILVDACGEIDLIDQLSAAVRSAERLITGSQGQQVINPLISELRQHRAALAGLLKQLNLPDEKSRPGGKLRSVQARSAAQARWSK